MSNASKLKHQLKLIQTMSTQMERMAQALVTLRTEVENDLAASQAIGNAAETPAPAPAPALVRAAASHKRAVKSVADKGLKGHLAKGKKRLAKAKPVAGKPVKAKRGHAAAVTRKVKADKRGKKKVRK